MGGEEVDVYPSTTTVAGAPGAGLCVTEERLRDGAVRLRLTGELDSWTGECLHAAARGGPFVRCDRFEVDLGGLTFVDCAGMRAVLEVIHRMEDVGGCVVLTAGPVAERLLDRIGVGEDRMRQVCAALEAAVDCAG